MKEHLASCVCVCVCARVCVCVRVRVCMCMHPGMDFPMIVDPCVDGKEAS